MLKTTIHFIITLVLTTLMITIVSSQLVLADVQSFGLNITLSERLSVTLKDIIGLSPILSLMIGLSFLVAFIIVRYAHSFLGGSKKLWTIAAGFSSFPLTLYLINYFMGVMLLASARNLQGMFFIACCSAIGGWIFNYLTASENGDINHA